MKSSAEDIILIERLQKGDVEAFDLIYDRYSGKLFSFGFKYLRSRDEAKELVQSVFVKIWENRKSLKKESCRGYHSNAKLQTGSGGIGALHEERVQRNSNWQQCKQHQFG